SQMFFQRFAVRKAGVAQIAGRVQHDSNAVSAQELADTSCSARQHGSSGIRSKQHKNFLANTAFLPTRVLILALFLCGKPLPDPVSCFAESQFTQSNQSRLTEEILQSPLRLFRAIDNAALKTMDESARRKVNHDDFIGLLYEPVGYSFANNYSGDVPYLVIQTFQVLDIHGG